MDAIAACVIPGGPTSVVVGGMITVAAVAIRHATMSSSGRGGYEKIQFCYGVEQSFVAPRSFDDCLL